MISNGLRKPPQTLRSLNGTTIRPIHPLARFHVLQLRWLSTVNSVGKISTPLRKQLKDETKRKRQELRNGTPMPKDGATVPGWELTVGIEIHAELNTASKLFSKAPTPTVEAVPNTSVAEFDLAYPGSQPSFQVATLLPAVRAAIALNCSVQKRSTFDRKHYFYQDQPAGYQITQYYEPFARDGYITLYDHDGIAQEDGKQITIGIKQLQMEQDTAKTIQNPPSEHWLDFNRVSHPLIEIITLPQIHHPATAAALARKVQTILKSVNACTTGMELGGLRADVNVSVRRQEGAGEYTKGSYHSVTGLGQRTEIKNLSSFKAVEEAIIAERNRQISVLEGGGTIEGETRGWSLGSTETRKLRGKEGEIDYRYMPDPDIAPVIISAELIQHLTEELPKLPDSLFQLLTTDSVHGLTMKDAKTLLAFDDGGRLEYYFEVLSHVQKASEGMTGLGRVVGNWVIHELGSLLGKDGTAWIDCPVSADQLAHIIILVQAEQITNSSGKHILALLFDGETRSIDVTAKEDGLLVQSIPESAYIEAAERLVKNNQEMVQQIKDKGQMGKIMWFVGQMIKEMSKIYGKGSVKPEAAKEAVLKAMDFPSG